MQVYPTRTSAYLALAGALATVIGLLLQRAVIVSWAGGILVGLALARGVTIVSVARIRRSGFEMLWQGHERVRRIARGETIELFGEVRNRDARAARYVCLRPVCSPALDVSITPNSGEVPASGRLRVTLSVRGRRVGRHGIHGLSLEVQGSPGLFEVPLTFANPFGIEVLPHAYALVARSARGGRNRTHADAGRAGPLAGDGLSLRELREHHPGDPFKRIAWKASARRGVLLVRDFEREQRDTVWIVLDASVELWAGQPGSAPLDLAIDEVASVAFHHLSRGDSVGLAIVGSRILCSIPPARGVAHDLALLSALANTTGCLDADRSDLDESDVAMRVLEHLRPLNPQAGSRLSVHDLDQLGLRAERMAKRAPFALPDAHAYSEPERVLRNYMAAFGMSAPARFEPDRPSTDKQLAELIPKLLRHKPKPSLIYLWSTAAEPGRRSELQAMLRRFPKRQPELRWVSMRYETSLKSISSGIGSVVSDALSIRSRVAQTRGERALQNLGVRVQRFAPRRQSSA